MSESDNYQSNLFVLEKGPMRFYLGEGFERYWAYPRWVVRIEKRGGIVVKSPTGRAIYLVYSIPNITLTSTNSRYKQYDSMFVNDSIVKNEIQDLKKYRIFNVNLNMESTIESPISMLHDICLEEIFSYLSNEEIITMEKVCRQWKRASQLVWYYRTKLNYSYDFWDLQQSPEFCPDLFPKIEVMLNRCGSYLTELRLFYVCNSKILKVINENCPNVIILDIALRKYRMPDCIDAFYNLTKLKSLFIRTPNQIPAALLASIQDRSETIQIIEFEGEIDFNTSFPSKFSIPKFKDLQALRIADSFIHMRDLQAIIRNENLRILTLERTEKPDLVSYYDIISCLKNLEELQINSDIIRFDDYFVAGLARNCLKLKSLKLKNSSDITDIGVRELGELNNLEELYLDNAKEENIDITDLSIQEFRSLKKLGIEGCINITDSSIMELLDTIPNLEHLKLGETSITSETLLHAINIMKQQKDRDLLLIEADLYTFSDQFIELLRDIPDNIIIHQSTY